MSISVTGIRHRSLRLPVMRPPDRRLLRHIGELGGRLRASLALGLALTCLIAAQAALATRLLAGVLGTPDTAFGELLAGLAVVLTLRAAAAHTLRAVARRSAATVRSRLQRELAARVAGLGPFWLGRRADGEVTTLCGDGLDAIEDYLASYLPRVLLAWLVPPLIAVAGLAGLIGHTGGQATLLAAILAVEAGLALHAVTGLAPAAGNGWAAARQACAILDSPPAARAAAAPAAVVTNAPAGPRVRQRPRRISLHHVTLCYPGVVRPALADISLTVHPGEHLAITGPAGAGKSSLLALLLRFAQPTAGQIEYDGHDFGLIPDEQWLERVAWLPQHPHIFAGSVADNIAVARAGSTLDSIRQAARMAGADEIIEAMPDGYQTQLGGCGIQLSPAQLLFIELARAVLRDAPVLLLDEPTAQLPPDAAGRLLDGVATAFSGRTVIHVTRDPGLAHYYSRSLVLREGRLTQPIAQVPLYRVADSRA